MNLRRKVKDGELSVKEAVAWLDSQEVPDYAKIRAWLRRRNA